MKDARNSASMLCQPSSDMKKTDVDGDQPLGALRAQQGQRAGVVLHVDDQRADQRVDEAGDEEDGEEARAVQVLEGVARDHQEAPTTTAVSAPSYGR